MTDDEIRLIAGFMSDGGISNRQLVLSLSKEHHNGIRALLKRLGLDYDERMVLPGEGAYDNSKPYHRFRIPKGTHHGSLARVGWHRYSDYLDKAVAPALRSMTRSQFLLLWEELLKGDGERQENKSGWLWC